MELACLLQHRVLSPVAIWNLVDIRVSLDETSSFDHGLIHFECMKVSAICCNGTLEESTTAYKERVRLYAVVIRQEARVILIQNLNPNPGSDVHPSSLMP